MKKYISLILFFALLRCASAGVTKTLPVFLLDQDNVMSMTIAQNPFVKTSPEFFSDLAYLAIKRTQCVVIFIEESLCTEDLSTKDNLGTPFYNLENGIRDEKVIYMPAVNEPYKLLQEVFKPVVNNIVYIGAGEKLHLQDHHQYLYVYFEDEPKTGRLERLRKHDLLMKEVYFTVRMLKAGPILGFYTGKRNPISVEQLRYSPRSGGKPKERGVLVTTPDALFRLSGVFSSTHTRRSSFVDTPVVEHEMRTRKTLSTTMLVTDFHLQFNFEFGERKWKLANVALLEAGEEVGRTSTVITAPWQRSYYCSEPITIFNLRDGSFIIISEYQIEPMMLPRARSSETHADPNATVPLRNETTDPENAEPRTLESGHLLSSFSKSENCGPYFNSAILSGVLVFVLFTVITFWGVIMLINCGTNNRFDDPNQKPLIIIQEAGGHG